MHFKYLEFYDTLINFISFSIVYKATSRILTYLDKEIYDLFSLNSAIFYTAARTVDETSHAAFGKLLTRVNPLRAKMA